MREIWSRFLAASIAVVLLALHAQPTSAQQFPELTVDFDDADSLRATPALPGTGFYGPGAPLSFALTYTEHGMTFIPGLRPPDPRLGERGCTYGNNVPHIHLGYEDPSITYSFDPRANAVVPGREVTIEGKKQFVPLGDPALEPRFLYPHRGECVVQMTFNRGDRFDFISLEVHDEKLNLGVRFSTGGLGVANNLTEGFTWRIIGANDLTRATLERAFPPDDPRVWNVDDIVFRPLGSSSSLAATALGLGDEGIETIRSPLVEEIPEDAFPPSFHQFLHRVFRVHPCQVAPGVARATPGDDVIHGTKGSDVIDAGEGNDIVCGRAGRDLLIGGEGIDLLSGHRGNDQILGGGDGDRMRGGKGNDFLDSRDDVLNNDGNDGGLGTDICLGDSQDSLFRCERLSGAS
jgi:hypothetical protein